WKLRLVTPGLNVSVCVLAVKSLPAFAVPATVVTTTVTVVVDARERVTGTFTVVVPLSPSVTVALPTETVSGTGSSFTIVTVPAGSARLKPAQLVSLTVKLSFGSQTASPFTVTVTSAVVAPAANVAVPAVTPTKSEPAVAVPFTVIQPTVVARVADAELGRLRRGADPGGVVGLELEALEGGGAAAGEHADLAVGDRRVEE